MISRRSALYWLGVSAGAAGTLNTFSAFAKNMQPENGTRVIACECFCVTDAGQAPHLRAYIADTLVHSMDRGLNSFQDMANFWSGLGFMVQSGDVVIETERTL